MNGNKFYLNRMALILLVCFLTTSCAGFLGAQNNGSIVYSVQITVTSSNNPAVVIGSTRKCTWVMMPTGSEVTIQCEGYPELRGTFDGKTIQLTDEGRLYTGLDAFDGSFEDSFAATGSIREGFKGNAISVTRAPDGSERYRYESSIVIKK